MEAGPADGEPVLLLHGVPTWSYLYRHMIPPLARAGRRVLAPDLPGFGRSDRPARAADYGCARLAGWLSAWLEAREQSGITLVGQDWGAALGLRLAVESPRRFARIVVSNGALPTGREPVPAAFRAWSAFVRWTPWLPAGWVVQAGTRRWLSRAERKAYAAPFPRREHQVGARTLPGLVPTRPDDPGAAGNREAWRMLEEWEKPFLTAFSDGDPVTRGLDRPFRERVPGARGRDHVTVRGAGHFLQEDGGAELARIVNDFIEDT